jgi:hypothetical protein
MYNPESEGSQTSPSRQTPRGYVGQAALEDSVHAVDLNTRNAMPSDLGRGCAHLLVGRLNWNAKKEENHAEDRDGPICELEFVW